MRRRIAVLVAMAVMMVAMLAASAPAFAQGVGGCDPQPGQTEKSQSPHISPPGGKPSGFQRASTANEHDTSDPRTGFGQRVDERA